MNRSRLMAKNMGITIFFAVMNFILGLIEVRLFLRSYGSVINGLIQTGNQALSYLSLIESGICAAFLYYLYKPIGEGDYRGVSELYKGFESSIRRIVLLMLVAAMGLCAIMPAAIRDKSLDYGLSSAILALISLRFIAPYLISLAPKYMLIAREKKYKAEMIDGLKLSLVYLADIAMLVLWEPHILVLPAVNSLVVIGVSLLCRAMMRREYRGLLDPRAEADRRPTKMSGDLLAHNVSGLAFSSSANIVLAVFTPSLTAATIYSAYNRVVANIVATGQKIVEGANASIGVKLSRGEANIYSVFREIVSCAQLVFSIISIAVIACINPFIKIWIGGEYLLPGASACLFGLTVYAEIILRVCFTARNAKGLFKESRNFTVFQSVFNIGLALALVRPLGIPGIQIGIIAGRYLVGIPCNYRLIYTKVFPGETPRWWELVASPLLIVGIALVSQGLSGVLAGASASDVALLVTRLVVSVALGTCGCVAYQLACDGWFRPMLRRCRAIFKNRRERSQ